MAGEIAAYLEVGSKRVFACAFDWPGWCRSGKNEQQALDALAAAAPRYAVVAREAGASFPTSESLSFDIRERVQGSATTDFGAPGAIAALDFAPLGPDEAARLASLVAAGWTVFDRIAAEAPAELRKGPRGGGRDRDAIVAHVAEAEAAYARKLGIERDLDQSAGERRGTQMDRAGEERARQAIVGALRAGHEMRVVPERGWPPRYAARRIAWHVLDHAWEIEDRSE